MSNFLNLLFNLFKKRATIQSGMPVIEPVLPPTPPIPVKMIDLSKWHLTTQLEALAQTFLSTCASKGYNLKITQGLRTMAQQQALYNQGRTTPGKIVTNAKPGQSKHNFGLAFDICWTGPIPYPTDDTKWKAVADIGISCGLTAGYYFKSFVDKPHFEIQ